METFRIDPRVGRSYLVSVEEVVDWSPELIRTLIDIDLQTFSESTFSHYTATAFLTNGLVFVLQADGAIIGTCVCFRTWERASEVMVLTMGIRPGWRGRGLGQQFIKGIMERLQDKDIRSVSLLVSEDNRRAVRVYGDTGFEVVERMAEDPRTGERFLLMRAALSSPAPLQEVGGGE